MKKIEWIMLLSLSLLWGFSFINIKNSLQQIPPFTLVFLRLCIATAALLLWCYLRKKNLALQTKQHFKLMGAGLLACAIPFSFFTWGQQHVSTSIGSIFNGCVPFFTALLAHFLIGGKEQLSWRKALGLTIGLSGIVTIMGISNLSTLDLSNSGQLAMICACFFYASSGIYYQRIIGNQIDKSVATAFTLFWAAIAMSVVSISIEGVPSLDYRNDVWSSLIILALFSTALAYLILFQLLQRAGPSNTSLNTFIIPVVGIIIGTTWLHEQLQTKDMIGVSLIFLGIFIIQNFAKIFKQAIRA